MGLVNTYYFLTYQYFEEQKKQAEREAKLKAAEAESKNKQQNGPIRNRGRAPQAVSSMDIGRLAEALEEEGGL